MLRILVIIYIDSRLLYNYLVRLKTIDKKRLMINIMSLREVYKKKEISKVWWIKGRDNLVDTYMKKILNRALERLIFINILKIRVEVYIEYLD
jgi:phosphopentomutase